MDRKRPVTPKAWSSTGKVLPEHDVNLMLIANHPTKSSQNQTVGVVSQLSLSEKKSC